MFFYIYQKDQETLYNLYYKIKNKKLNFYFKTVITLFNI